MFVFHMLFRPFVLQEYGLLYMQSVGSVETLRRYFPNMLEPGTIYSLLVLFTEGCNICCKSKWKFINHNLIDATCLNSRGLHLNRKATSLLANNLSGYIKSDLEFAGREWHRSVDSCSTVCNSSIGSVSDLSGRGLSIPCLNINSLIAHIDQLRIFVHSLGSNIDVPAINETKLDSYRRSHSNLRFQCCQKR